MKTLDTFTTWLLLLAVLQGLVIGIVYLCRKNTQKLSDFLFFSLISAFTLTLLNNFLDSMNVFSTHPNLYFLPIYFTLSFGPMLFFYAKSALYPSFSLQKKDLKHFLLPIGQVSFFFFMYFRAANVKQYYWEYDFSPFYGTIGYPIYVIIFYAYQYFAYRFAKHRLKALQHISYESNEQNFAYRLKNMIKILFILMCINTTYVVSNFISDKFFGIQLNNAPFFSFINDFSFAAMVFWLGWYGIRVWKLRTT